jgi:biotin carboxyl carrier protein
MRSEVLNVVGLTALVAVVVGALAMGTLAAPRPLVDVKATLRGTVLADGLAKPGDDVTEGAPLVYVRTDTGRSVAARAPADGRVTDVLVRPGTVIRELGTVVAHLDPK